VEKIVNQAITQQLPVTYSEMSLGEAREQGAMGVFDSKYDDRVRVYQVTNFSKEICGGPHVNNTKELGHFKIVKEESSSAGVRRIKAILE
jgi:alanyl-tRNA synthetase